MKSIITCASFFLLCCTFTACSSLKHAKHEAILLETVRPEPDIIVEKNITITRGQLQRKLSHPESARLIEVFRGVEYNEKYPRYRIFDIKPNSTLALLGFKNGDILEGAHGYVIQNSSSFSRYIELLPSQNEGFFDIVRLGTPMKLRIKIS